MTKEFLFNFIQQHKFAVAATVSSNNVPESAYIGIAVMPDLRIIFDTVTDSRKYVNLHSNPNISLVIGWEKEQTVQYEGTARMPNESELETLLQAYFETFPEGKARKEKWKNIAYVCVEPKWIRYSNYTESEPRIEEMKFCKI
jgi:general stress protein 26